MSERRVNIRVSRDLGNLRRGRSIQELVSKRSNVAMRTIDVPLQPIPSEGGGLNRDLESSVGLSRKQKNSDYSQGPLTGFFSSIKPRQTLNKFQR